MGNADLKNPKKGPRGNSGEVLRYNKWQFRINNSRKDLVMLEEYIFEMSRFHTKEQIDNYEEEWQKQFYLKSGDHYVHVCEICHRTNDNVIIRLPGGHYVCDTCKKKLKLPNENTIVRWGIKQKTSKWNQLFPHLAKQHPSEPSNRERGELWKRIIKKDYMIELFNKNFKYE